VGFGSHARSGRSFVGGRPGSGFCQGLRRARSTVLGEGSRGPDRREPRRFQVGHRCRTGLDIGNPDLDTCRVAFDGWKNDDFRETREFAKPIRDRLLRIAFDLSAERRVPIHIHSGGGDPDVLLRFARPANMFDLLTDCSSHPVVLIHARQPLDRRSRLPRIDPAQAYVDTSVMVPWHSLAIDQKLEVFVGVVPPAKIMYGSDEANEPEVLWQSAHVPVTGAAVLLRTGWDRHWGAERYGDPVHLTSPKPAPRRWSIAESVWSALIR